MTSFATQSAVEGCPSLGISYARRYSTAVLHQLHRSSAASWVSDWSEPGELYDILSPHTSLGFTRPLYCRSLVLTLASPNARGRHLGRHASGKRRPCREEGGSALGIIGTLIVKSWGFKVPLKGSYKGYYGEYYRGAMI